jgi:hypothetical protein
VDHGSISVIRIVAVGVIGLVGMGAVAALGRNAAPLKEVAVELYYPATETGGKSDRLPLKTEHDTIEAVFRGDAAPATMPAQAAVEQPPSQHKADHARPAPNITSRHWHDPADSNFTSQKRSSVVSKRLKTVQSEKPERVSEAKNCSQNGADTRLRSLNLKPRCDL